MITSLAPTLALIRDDALLPLTLRAARALAALVHPLDPAAVVLLQARALAWLERRR